MKRQASAVPANEAASGGLDSPLRLACRRALSETYACGSPICGNGSSAAAAQHIPSALSIKRNASLELGSRTSPLALTAGTALLLLLVFLMGAAPAVLPLMYLLFATVALPHRFCNFLRRRWGFFLLDYCYCANLGVIAYLLLCPYGSCGKETMAVIWALSEGPLAAAIIPWQCAWLPSSHEHITSTLIHTLPGLAVFATRHAGPMPAWLRAAHLQLPWNPTAPSARLHGTGIATARRKALSASSVSAQRPQRQLRQLQLEGISVVKGKAIAAGIDGAAAGVGAVLHSDKGHVQLSSSKRHLTKFKAAEVIHQTAVSFALNVWQQTWQQTWRQHSELELEIEGSDSTVAEGERGLPRPCLWLLVLPIACHCAWQLMYLVVVQGCFRRMIKAQGYETSYSSLARRASRTNNLWNRVVRQGSTTRRVLVYGALHGAFTAAALLWAAVTWMCFPLAVAWQVIKILLPLYYGAALMCRQAERQVTDSAHAVASISAQHGGWNGHASCEHSTL